MRLVISPAAADDVCRRTRGRCRWALSSRPPKVNKPSGRPIRTFACSQPHERRTEVVPSHRKSKSQEQTLHIESCFPAVCHQREVSFTVAPANFFPIPAQHARLESASTSNLTIVDRLPLHSFIPTLYIPQLQFIATDSHARLRQTTQARHS